MNHQLIDQVKANLILAHDEDDELIANLVVAATSYATAYQHLPEDYYEAGLSSKMCVRSACRRSDTFCAISWGLF